MAKYMLVIQKLNPVVYDMSMEFEEGSKAKAIVRAREIFEEESELFSKGEYLGKLYKNSFLFGWRQIYVPDLTHKSNNR